MIPDLDHDTYVTTHFRTLGYAGAVLFTLAPPAFLYEVYLTFYTTAVEDNPTIGIFMAVSLILSFASVPMMIAGRRRRYSVSPTVDTQPASVPIARNAASNGTQHRDGAHEVRI